MSRLLPLLLALGGPVALGLTLTPSSAAAQETVALAVLPFANQTGDSSYDALGKGLADMMTTDLSAASGLTLVERSRLQAILDELALAEGGFIDPETAAKAGKGVGARYVLTGSISAVAPQMRLDARVIDVQSGEVVDAAESTGPTEEFFLLEKELAEVLSDELGVTLSSRERARMGRIQTESFAAFQSYSEGLSALDRGELDAAQRKLQDALEADDRFDLASAALDGAQARLDATGARSDRLRSEQSQRVYDGLLVLKKESEASGQPPSEEQLNALISPNVWRAQLPHDARDVYAIANLVLDLGMPDSARVDIAIAPMAVNEWALAHRTLAALQLRQPSEVVTVGQELLERFPTTTWAASLRAGIQGQLDILKKQQAGREELPLLRKQARFTEHFWTCTADLSPQRSYEACEKAYAEVADLTPDVRAEAGRELVGGAIHAGQHDRAREVAKELEALLAAHPDYEDVERHVSQGIRPIEQLDKTLAEIEKRTGDLPKSTRGYQHAIVSDRLAYIGRHAEAREMIDQGLAAFPDDPDLLEQIVENALKVHDLDTARSGLEAWAAVEEPMARMANEVKRLPEDIAEAREGRARALKDLADSLNRRALYSEAGDTWMLLAREEVGVSPVTEPNMLVQAGWNYVNAGRIDDAREVLGEVQERFPDEQAAGTARIHLTTLPL